MTPEVKARLAEMGVTEAKLRHVYEAPSQEEGERRLGDLQAACKEGFRKLALELHPDVTGGDPDKTARFKRLKSIYESFMRASYKGWRKRNGRQRGSERFSGLGGWADFYPTGDPLMDNFRRMKAEAKRQREDDLMEMFADLMRQQTVGTRRPRHKPRPRAKPKPKRKIQPLADRKGVWFLHEGKWIIQHKRRSES